MTKKKIIMAVAIISLVALGMAQVDNSDTTQTRRYQNRVNRIHTFDVANPVNVEGKILKVSQCTQGKGRFANGLTLAVKTKEGESTVHMGPQRYINSNHLNFKAGDKIKLSAFPGTGDFKEKLFAAEVTANGTTLTFRDKEGIPSWSMGKSRQGRRQGKGQGQGRNNRGRRNCNRLNSNN